MPAARQHAPERLTREELSSPSPIPWCGEIDESEQVAFDQVRRPPDSTDGCAHRECQQKVDHLRSSRYEGRMRPIRSTSSTPGCARETWSDARHRR